MSLAAELLFQQILKAIPSLTGRTAHASIADAIIDPLSAYDLEIDDIKKAIVVDFRDEVLVAQRFAGDCCRLATASFQTISIASQSLIERDAISWGMIKLYYAAFYAGNALLRLMGESCSFFDKSHSRRLTKISDALGRERSFAIDAGLYHCIVLESRSSLRAYRVRAGAGGAHESFWYVFGALLNRMSENVLKGDFAVEDAQKVFRQLDNLTQILALNRDFSWLSVVRNEIQYRNIRSLWFPSAIRARNREKLSRMSQKWSADPMSIDLSTRSDDLERFVSACSFIVALCKSILDAISNKAATKNRCFAYIGPLAFINDVES